MTPSTDTLAADPAREAAIRRHQRRVYQSVSRQARMARRRSDPSSLPEGLVAEVRRRTLAGESVRSICRALRVSTDTVAVARAVAGCVRPQGWSGGRRVQWVRLTCLQCGREYELQPFVYRKARGGRKYCSVACRDAAEREVFACRRERRTCLWCGAAFEFRLGALKANPRRGRFCCKRHAALWHWHKGSRRCERRVS